MVKDHSDSERGNPLPNALTTELHLGWTGWSGWTMSRWARVQGSPNQKEPTGLGAIASPCPLGAEGLAIPVAVLYSFHCLYILKFKHADLGTGLSYLDCLSGQWVSRFC